MGAFERIRRTRLGRRVLGETGPLPPEPGRGEAALRGEIEADDLNEYERRKGIAGWVEERAQSVVSKMYETRADDIETRARRAVSSAYRDQADDLEERAVRAMRRALAEESERIKEVIEHSVAVKKREVRLSLLVLITAALVYLALDVFVNRGGPS